MLERFYTVDTSSGAVADNGTLTLSLATPAGDGTRIFADPLSVWAAGTQFECDVLYNVTQTGGTGTALTVKSLDGGSVTTDASCLTDPTVTDSTATQHYLFGGAANTGAYLQMAGTEFALTADSTYAFRVTNRSGGSAPVSIVATFKEVTYPGIGF